MSSTVPLTDTVDYYEKNVLPSGELKEKTAKNLLWVAIISMVMLFGGLTSAVIVSKGGKFWVNVSLPSAFWISTGLVLAGSLTLILAKKTIAANNLKATKLWLTLTLLLGIGFGVSQFQGYKQLVDRGHFLTAAVFDSHTGKFIPKGEYGKDFTISWQGETLKYDDGMFFNSKGPLSEPAMLKLKSTENTSSSFIYFISFLHLLHMVGGVIYLMVVTAMAYQERFHSGNYLKIKLANMYWHFLGILWIYLFVFLQYIH